VTRANLLPRPTVTWTVFGVTLERATVAEALLGAFVIALAGGATVTFEALQVAGAHAQATQLEGLVATHSALTSRDFNNSVRSRRGGAAAETMSREPWLLLGTRFQQPTGSTRSNVIRKDISFRAVPRRSTTSDRS
jgi:hypothetical protein